MKILNKKTSLVLLLTSISMMLTGCTAPKDETGNFIKITTETTFKQMFESEGWFNTIFVYPLSQVINYLTPIIGVALAIVIVTVVVNGVILAFTLKSTIQSQQMQLLQPEMDKINKKYEGKTDDASRMKQAKEVENLYKKYNINPFGAILTMMLQLPIVIAMYQAVQRAQAVYDSSFIGMNLAHTPLFGIQNKEFLYLALFVVMLITQLATMQLPQYLAKRKALKEAEIHHRKPEITKNPNQNMMYAMMAPILFFSLTWPAAMTLYWIINNCVNMIKTLIVQNYIDKHKLEGGIK